MKCTKGENIVCYKYEKCSAAAYCENVPRGIREKLLKKTRNKNKKQ